MGKRFVNEDGSDNLKRFAQLWQWQRERSGKKKDLSFRLPQVTPDVAGLADNRSKTTVTFIGHSTFLIQTGGLHIITDPVWATRMGPGKRLSPPGMAIDDMPKIDVVLLSHSHYDHLHLPSLRSLPGDFLILAPEGLGKWLRRKGFPRVEELTWWGQHKLEQVQFNFVPARHWTRRTLFDTNRSHWGGWVMEYASTCLYFAGDSGYAPLFREIGIRFPKMDVAMLPIGAYEPEWFMRDSHMSPEEAVQAFEDLGADYFVPMHYGAFHLADDTADEALQRLDRAWQQQGLADERLWRLELGRTRSLE